MQAESNSKETHFASLQVYEQLQISVNQKI